MPAALRRKPLPKPAPESDPRFRRVMEQLKQGSARVKAHPSASKKAADAAAAAKGPPNERIAGGKAKQVDKIKEAKEGKPEQSSFLATLRAEIAKAMPKNLGETEPEKFNSAADEMKGGLKGNVSQQKESSTKDVSGASKQAPAPAGEAKAETPLPREGAPAAPSVNAPEGMPAPKNDADVSLQDSKQDVDQQMKDAEVTPTQLQKANDPRFSAVLAAKSEVAQNADAGPAKYRAAENATLAGAAAAATTSARAGAAAMLGVRAGGNARVLTRQQMQRARDEAKRKEVTDKIEAIYNATKTRVEAKLNAIDDEVNGMFDRGVDAALNAMTSFVNAKIRNYKIVRYLSIPLVGLARWIRDQFKGLPDEVNVFYDQGRRLFQAQMDVVIVRVAAVVEQRLKEAKAEVAKGQAEIKAFVASQPRELQQVAQQAAGDVSSRFQELERGIEDKKSSLAQGLAQKYKEAFDKANDALKKIQDENKGFVQKFVEKLAEVFKALLEFKAKLDAILAKGRAAIKIILADPIQFLGYLIAAVKGGIQAFKDHFLEHLKRGFVQWLLGNLPPGIELPTELSLPAILKLVLGVLGITYEKMRAKAVRLIGERNVKIIEKVVEYIRTLITGGPAALWEKVKEDLSNLKAMVIDAIQNWIVTTIVKQAIAKIVSLFNPVGAIVQAILAIYNIVLFVVEQAQKILAFIEAVVNSLYDIATGNIGGAIKKVEDALARTIPIVIGFLARLLGLGGISDKIREFITKVQDRVDKAIDKAIAKIVEVIKKTIGRLLGRDTDRQAAAAGTRSPEVTAGLGTLHALGRAKEKDGKLSKVDAEAAAAETKQRHPVFKYIRVVAGQNTWDYKYAASPEDTETGEPSREEVEVYDTDVIPPAEKPKKDEWYVSMKIKDRNSPDVFLWGLILIPIDPDLGIPKSAPGPSMYVTSRTTRVDKTPVKLKLLGSIKSWTDLGLHWTFRLYRERWGTQPDRLEGNLTEKNLANFQAEYLKAFWIEGLSRDAALQIAIRRISFGSKRVALGFNKFEVKPTGWQEETRKIGDNERKVMVPVGVNVIATR